MASPSSLVRFAPVAAVATISLNSGYEGMKYRKASKGDRTIQRSLSSRCSHEGKALGPICQLRKRAEFPFLHSCSRTNSSCQEVSTSGTRIRPFSFPKCGNSSRTGLLGQSHWIYRLVSTEDVTKVYHLERELGQGGFGTVYMGRHKEMGYRRAVKKICKGPSLQDHEELMNEIYNLMDLDHPHIIKLARMYDDGRNLYMVSELCSGPSLFDRIVNGPMSEQEVRVALRHMLKAVHCCHSHYMGHYDIKPENFMYSDAACKELKMIDLGLSSGFKHDPNELKGTIFYTAPEVLSGMYGPEADIWSCGVVLFAMATGASFCPSNLPQKEVEKMLHDRRWIKERLNWASEEVSAECMDLLHKMLSYDRHMRITTADALRHPFIDDPRKVPRRKEDTRKEEAAMQVIKSMADRFVDFGAEPMLVRAALLIMVHIAGYVTQETKANRVAYSMLDEVGRGELSIDSIEAIMPKYGLAIPENIDDAFRAVDLNQNGYITYGNFLSATLPHSLRCRQDLCQRVFRLLDQNRDGFIDQDDLAAAFLSKETCRDEQFRTLCRQAIAEVASSSSELRLNFEDFLRMMVGNNSPIPANDSIGSYDFEEPAPSEHNVKPK